MQEKKKTARNIGILSIVASLVIPVVGIVLSALNWIIGIFLHMS